MEDNVTIVTIQLQHNSTAQHNAKLNSNLIKSLMMADGGL